MIYIDSHNLITSYKVSDKVEAAVHDLLVNQTKGEKGIGYDFTTLQKMYEKGLNDMWECARKIVCDCNYPNNHLRQYVTDGDTLVKFFIDTSASDAIAKVNEYELKQKCKKCKYYYAEPDYCMVGEPDVPNDMEKQCENSEQLKGK